MQSLESSKTHSISTVSCYYSFIFSMGFFCPRWMEYSLTNISFLLFSDNSHMNHFAWTVKHGQTKRWFLFLRLEMAEACRTTWETHFLELKTRRAYTWPHSGPPNGDHFVSLARRPPFGQGVVSLKTLIHLRPINRIKMWKKRKKGLQKHGMGPKRHSVFMPMFWITTNFGLIYKHWSASENYYYILNEIFHSCELY